MVVAMSGGVDSTVVAALLQQAGYEVEGVTAQLWETAAAGGSSDRAAGPAAPAAARLGIPLHAVDATELFQRQVIDPFVQSYVAGSTPNPCVECNRYVKFGLLLDWALEQGADYLATGHYARIRHRDGTYQLLRAADVGRDQSYVLYRLTQAQLSRIFFPLGEHTKEQVRAIARDLALPNAERPDSQDICFIPGRDYRDFVAQRMPAAMQPGPIFDNQGRLLGRHRGMAAYTIGQRQGLNLTSAEPLYVLQLDVQNNALVVGRRRDAACSRFSTTDTHWIAPTDPRDHPDRLHVQIRYRSQPVAARVQTGANGRAEVELDTLLNDVTPGQAAVFYCGEVCLGGGTIAAREKRA